MSIAIRIEILEEGKWVGVANCGFFGKPREEEEIEHIPVYIMSQQGLDVPKSTNFWDTKYTFWFTLEGWNRVGKYILDALENYWGVEFRVKYGVRPPTIVAGDELQFQAVDEETSVTEVIWSKHEHSA